MKEFCEELEKLTEYVKQMTETLKTTLEEIEEIATE